MEAVQPLLSNAVWYQAGQCGKVNLPRSPQREKEGGPELHHTGMGQVRK